MPAQNGGCSRFILCDIRHIVAMNMEMPHEMIEMECQSRIGLLLLLKILLKCLKRTKTMRQHTHQHENRDPRDNRNRIQNVVHNTPANKTRRGRIVPPRRGSSHQYIVLHVVIIKDI